MAVQEPVGSRLWQVAGPLSLGWPQSDEGAVGVLAEDWAAAGRTFAATGGRRPEPAAWADDGGTAFGVRMGRNLDAATLSAQGMNRVAGRAGAFAAEVAGVKSGIVDLVAANETVFGFLGQLPFGVAPAAQQLFAGLVAGEVDTMITDAADRVAGTGGAPPAIPPPPVGRTPQEWGDYWRSLTPDQRTQLAREQPDLIGNQDGVFAEHRDLANRILIERERADTQREVDDLKARLAAVGPTEGPANTGNSLEHGRLTRQLADAEQELTAIDHLRGLPGPGQGGDNYLLKIDSDGDGRAIVAMGNPDTAANVATWVPGVATDLGDMPGQLRDANAIRDAAGGDTAVISWLGYDTPESVPEAPFSPAVDAAAVDLNRFQEGLRASHDPAMPSHNTLGGHSYGGYVAAVTARDNVDLPVDTLITAAAPGVGSSHVSELNLAPGAVWATEADGDWIADVGSVPFGPFGRDPTNSDFEANTFNSNHPVPPADPHNSYLQPGPGLDNIGDIIAGRRPDDRPG